VPSLEQDVRTPELAEVSGERLHPIETTVRGVGLVSASENERFGQVWSQHGREWNKVGAERGDSIIVEQSMARRRDHDGVEDEGRASGCVGIRLVKDVDDGGDDFGAVQHACAFG
jgi:hypothetical protein